jgi:glutamate decarboxylase
MKRLWQQRRKEKGLSIHEPGPNIVMGANAQVALEKFARYFDVECRLVPISKESHYRLDPQKAMQYVDENTIGVFVILGSTYTGHYEPVKEMADLLDEYEKNTGVSVPYVFFMLPFTAQHSPLYLVSMSTRPLVVSSPRSQPPSWYGISRSPELSLSIPPGVCSISFELFNVDAQYYAIDKFGLAQVGVGWVVWRSKKFLPKDLIFELHYLGSVEYSFSLNFSRPAAPIIAQYFMFLHLGFAGYRAIALQDLTNARTLSRALENSGYYEVLSDIHRSNSSVLGDVKSALVAEQGDVEVCALICEDMLGSDDFKELLTRAPRGCLQVLREFPHQVPRRQPEMDPDALAFQGLDCAKL